MIDDSPQPRLVVYDGDCPVCTAAAERLRKRTWSSPHEIVAFQDLEPELSVRMTEAGIARRMLVLDQITDEISGGFDAVREIEAASGHGFRARLLGVPGFRQLGALGYRLFAVNRRLLSPVAHDLDCSCDPDPTVWDRALLWLFLALPVVVLGLQFGVISRPGYLALAAAWLVPALPAALTRAGFVRTLGQLLVTLGVAAVVGFLVWFTAGVLGRWLPAIEVRQPIVTLAAMWWVGGVMLTNRFRTLGVPRLNWVWLAVTLAVLAVASATWCPLR